MSRFPLLSIFRAAGGILNTSEPGEQRGCVTLLKAYGALSGILLVGDLLSLGAILGQVRNTACLEGTVAV